MKLFNKKTRTFSQIIFFFLFIFLITKSEFTGNTKNIDSIKLPYPVSMFLEIDPLIAISTLLSSHTIYNNLIYSLIIIVLTLFLGRFFCGWVCPLGTINHFISSFNFGKLKGKGRLQTNSYKNWQKIKYYILFFLLSASIFTTVQIGLLDPICLITRTMSTFLIPTINYSFIGISSFLYNDNIPFLNTIANFLLYLGQHTIIPYKPVYYNSTLLISLIFIIIVFANRYVTRFWCRLLCPLGALLGVFSKYSIFGLEKNEKLCTNCNRCELYCQGGDDPQPGKKWRSSECHLCLNCISECPENALKFKFFPGKEFTISTPDISKRKAITSIIMGVFSVPLLRSEAGLDVNYSSKLIRPPGALEEKDFLSKCVKCSACMKVCPNNALHPTFSEAGFEGLWTPTLIPRIGYCEPSCTLCSTVCPTGAINEINQYEKGWVSQNETENSRKNPIKIGLAFIDKGRCLPWAMNTPCIVCEEWCPTSPKSIYLEEIDSFKRNGEPVHLKRPIVDPALCVGCGACEFACPLEERPAIYITNIGETRSKTNQILLKEGV